MPENAHRSPSDGSDEPGRPPRDPFSLEAYLEAQFEAFKDGPTMAEIVADMDRFRRSDGPTTDEIVEALHEGRREREDHLDSLWQR